MCLAVPARIVQLEGTLATVDIEGNRRTADVTLIENPAVGDYVIVHAGFAIVRYDEAEALETLRLLREIGDALEP